MQAWHFLANDGKLGYDDGRKVKVGETYTCEGEPDLCKNGMHGSVRIIHALRYAPGDILCRVEIEGGVIEGDDKIVGKSRKVLAMHNASSLLHLFACDCAEDALLLVESPDPRSVAAIKAKRGWVAGTVTDGERSAARSAAGSAAGSAAWSAAWSAAGSAAWPAARSAAGSAAGSAAWSAAGAAARAAARSAAGAAARAAAWAAARADARAAAESAARAAQSERLEAAVKDLFSP